MVRRWLKVQSGRAGRVTLATLVCAATMIVALSSGPQVAGASGPHITPVANKATDSAYAVVDAAGGIATYGGAGYSGDTLGVTLNKPIVDAAADPRGGYWMVASDGGIFTFGGAQFYGSTGAMTLNKPIVGMAATPDGAGYWLVASDGGIFSYGDSQFYGSTGAMTLNKPIVGMASTPDGGGYWLVASDGGIFAFGDAAFYGSTGAMALNKPIVGMTTTADGGGYWLVASDGGIFAFGDAAFYGSTGNIALNSPIVSIAPTPDGHGYWMVGADAGIFTFGDANFSGSAQSPLHPPLFPAGFSSPIPNAVAIIADAPGPQAAHQGRLRVAFEGDSLGFYEGEYTLGTNPAYMLDNGAAPGCGINNGAPIHPWNNLSQVYDSSGACALWSSQLQWVTSRFHPDVSILQAGYWEAQDRLFDGQYQTLSDSAYAAFIQSNLQQAVNILHSDGGAVILATSPLFDDGTPGTLVSVYNQEIQAVANANSSFVSVLDVYSILDPTGAYAATVNGVLARTPDGVHLTQAGVTDLITPPLDNMVTSEGQPVYNGAS